MLDPFQITQVWENMLAAQTRTFYFADLASRYTRRKQIITGLSFFLSSGAAAAVVGKLPTWVPLLLSLAIAVPAAYSMALNLDRKIGTMVKLQADWSRIYDEYAILWSHTEDDDAEGQLSRIIELGRAPSHLAATDAPNDQKLIGFWQDRVFALHGLSAEHA